MIIILTQCFPSRVGGIETLMYDIALNLSLKHNVKVLADQQDSAVKYCPMLIGAI